MPPFAGSALLCALALTPQEVQRPVALSTRSARAPVIDGRLDDAVWRAATPIGELVQLEPLEGAPPTEATEIRFLHDDERLYMAIRCFDR